MDILYAIAYQNTNAFALIVDTILVSLSAINIMNIGIRNTDHRREFYTGPPLRPDDSYIQMSTCILGRYVKRKSSKFASSR